MEDEKPVQYATLTLERLWPRLQRTFRKEAKAAPADWQAFEKRLRQEWDHLFELLFGFNCNVSFVY